MEFHSQLLCNFTSIAVTVFAIAVAIITIIHRLKRRWRVTVNCWFCNLNAKIFREKIDWWQCPSCEQYNGFSKDGSYNYDIPEQRDKSLNNAAKLYSSPIKSDSLTKKNGLCKACNRNEKLKLYELRSIDLTTWRDIEVNNLKKNLEDKYPLCKKCNTFVKKVLHKQSMWLTQYKMLAFKQKPIKLIVNNTAKLETLCRIFLTVLCGGIIYYPPNQVLPIISALLQLIAAKIVSIPRRNFDLLLTILWMGVGVLMPFNHVILLKVNVRFTWITLEYITGYQIITVLLLILGISNIISKSLTTTNTNMSFKKLDSSIIDYHQSMPPMPNDIDHDCISDDIVIQSSRRSPVDITHLLTTRTPSLNFSESMKSPIFSVCESQRSSLSATTIDTQPIDILEPSSKHLSTQNNHLKKSLLYESLKTLSSLSLSENHQKQTLKNPKIFETKIYGTTNSELFRRNYKANSKKYILAPPKLKAVSQTSWVAGGYWQSGMDSPTLSRSSSQSSGFGSASSIFGASREPSVVNDIDRCSTMSDTTQCYNNIQQQNISPTNIFCQQTLSSSPSCRVAGAEFMTGCMMSSTNVINSNQCSQPLQSSHCHSYHINDQCLRNRNMNLNMIQRNSDVPPCVHYPSTILTSPILLPALLCGSVIFNMIVFCTVLLR